MRMTSMRHDRNSLHSEATINLDVRTVDVARQILDEHADGMCDFLGLRECARRNSLLVPANIDQ